MVVWAVTSLPTYREQLRGSSEHNDWLQSVRPVLVCQPSSYTVLLAPCPSTTISAPRTERIALYFHSPIPESHRKRCRDRERCLQHVLRPSGSPKARGCLGIVAGWSTEKVKRKGSTGNIYTVLFGWQSENAGKRITELCAFTEVLAGPTSRDERCLEEAVEWGRQNALGFNRLISP